jgi:hypothetical protein
MAEEPTPTYREETVGDTTRYVCIVGDAGAPEGICGWWSRDMDLMTQHQHQRHAGSVVPEAASAPPATETGHAPPQDAEPPPEAPDAEE